MGKTERKERKEREEYMLTNGGLLLERRIYYFDGKYSNPMRSFSADELQKATDSYNHENRIFGDTSHFRWYKGCFEGRLIFVKKYMDSSIPTHSRSFLADPEMVANEISVAAQLSGHKNSLKLLGCCLETQIPILVFEFPMNGNLELFLSITNDFKDDQKEDHSVAPIQSYVRNHGINGTVDPEILAEGGGVYHHHQFQAVFQLGL